MTDPNYALLLYMGASIVVALLKFFETSFVGVHPLLQDDPQGAARRAMDFYPMAASATALAFGAHLLWLGLSPLAAAWPLGFVVWQLLLREDADELRASPALH